MSLTFYSRLIWDWGVRAFGADHMLNVDVRAVRLAEEVIELVQVGGVPREQLHKLVDMVYDREPGDRMQEAGGVFVTFLAYCRSATINPMGALETEILRVLAKPPEHFAARNQSKLDSGLTG